MTGGTAIDLGEVGKRYEPTWILTHINLSIQRGESIALFGGNGSGKTTLLKIIATLLAPSTGTLFVLGHDGRKEKQAIRRRIRFLGHEKQLYGSLTVRENMELARRIGGGTTSVAESLKLIDHMGIGHAAHFRVHELSEGMKKRLVLAKILLGNPELILCDEPYPGLDAQGKEIFNDLVRRWRREEKTLLIASHDHAATLAHTDRVLTLENRKLSDE